MPKYFLPFKRITALIIVLTVLLMPVRQTYAAGYFIDETIVSDDAYIEYVISIFATPQFPSIDGSRVVWKDDRNGNADIYMYDLMADTETRITTDSNTQQWPVISGDYIVWQDGRNGAWDIYMYDLGTDTETRVTTDSGNSSQPCVYGDTIVWHDDRNDLTTGYDIYQYDIPSTTESVLVDAAGDQMSPWIDNDVAVWEDYRGGASNIYFYDYNNPIEDGSVVMSTATDQYWPATDGTTVTWTEDTGSGTGYDVYAFSLAEDELVMETTDDNTQAFGHVDGDQLVFTDNRDGNWNVYIYNLAVGQEFPLITNGFDQGMARIQGLRVVWMDGRNSPEYPGPTSLDELFLEASSGQVYTGFAAYDGTAPTFGNLPGEDDPINTGDGTINTNPFDLQVKPEDDRSGVDHVDFYADDTLLCTDRSPDENGVYECSWDPSETCGAEQIRVIATDLMGNVSEVLSRDVEVSAEICPALADTGSRLVPVAVGVGGALVVAAVLPKAVVLVRKKG